MSLQSETISIVSVESDVALYVLKGYSGHHLPTRSIYKSSPRWRPRRIFSGSSSWAWRCMRPHWVSEILNWVCVMTLVGGERCNKTTAIDCRNICENKCENYQSSLRSGFLNVIPWGVCVVAELHLSRTSSVKSILSTPLLPLPGGWMADTDRHNLINILKWQDRLLTNIVRFLCLILSPCPVHSPPRIIKQPPPDELLFQVAQAASENDKPFIVECEAEGEPAPRYVPDNRFLYYG